MPEQGRVGDVSKVQMDAHGCPACPHTCVGPAIVGSPDVVVNDLPALRVTDVGMHAACCGPNMWTARKGSPTVLINNLQAHRRGDDDLHCGGMGALAVGSPNVLVGDSGSGGGGSTGATMRAASASGAPLVPTDCDGEGTG